MTEATQQAQDPNTSTNSDAAGGAAAAAGAAAAGGGGGRAAAAWYETLQDEGLKTNPRIQRLGSVEDVAKSLIHAEKALGLPADQVIRIPADPNDKEALRGIYTRLGLPDKPEGYGLKLADTASDQDKATLDGFTKIAHEAGVTKAQIEPLMQWWQSEGEKALKAQEAAFAAQRDEGEKVLKAEWGTTFDQKSREIGRLATELGGPELGAELTTDKLGNHPQLAKMLGKLIDRMAEPGGPGGQAGEAVRLQGGQKLTPTQATAALNALESDPVKGKAILDRNHPQHAEVLKERSRLLRMKDGLDPDQ